MGEALKKCCLPSGKLVATVMTSVVRSMVETASSIAIGKAGCDLAAMLDGEPALGGYVLVGASPAGGCEMVARWVWCVRRNKWRVARGASELSI